MGAMLKDPEMLLIIIGFCDECDNLCEELNQILEEFENDLTNTQLLEKFGQVIDRIMGAAKSIEASIVGQFCELGKTISYKASQTTETQLLTIVAATLTDDVEIVQSLIANIRSEQEEKVDDINVEAFGKRLTWLVEKFKDIKRSSVAAGSAGDDNLDQDSIDKILDQLK